jgi:hypothetical protein
LNIHYLFLLKKKGKKEKKQFCRVNVKIKQCVIAILDLMAMPMSIQFNLKEKRRKIMMLLHFEVVYIDPVKENSF